jgi:hypothetical protein
VLREKQAKSDWQWYSVLVLAIGSTLDRSKQVDKAVIPKNYLWELLGLNLR